MQGLVATAASAVGFGGALMAANGWLMTLFGVPLVPNNLEEIFLIHTLVVSG